MAKTANDPWDWTVPRAADSGHAAKWSALKTILASLLGGAAVGGTVTGISGLRKMLKKPEMPTSTSEVSMPIPIPEKQAEDGSPVGIGTLDWLKGDHADSALQVPWLVPGVAAGLGVGTLGTSALVEHLLHKKRKAMLDKELQEAQHKFQGSLLGQYKQSSSDPLDAVYNNLEKCAIDPPAPPIDIAGMPGSKVWDEMKHTAPAVAVGGGLTLAALLAAIAARGSYKTQEGRSQEDLLQKAIKHKSYLQSLRNPQTATLDPVEVSGE